MSEEFLKSQEISRDDETKNRLEAEGWQRAGREFTVSTPFNSDTARFENKGVITDDEIKEKYLNLYAQHGFTEVHLEPHKETFGDKGTSSSSLIYVYMR